jgi:hypothetical protein
MKNKEFKAEDHPYIKKMVKWLKENNHSVGADDILHMCRDKNYARNVNWVLELMEDKMGISFLFIFRYSKLGYNYWNDLKNDINNGAGLFSNQ